MFRSAYPGPEATNSGWGEGRVQTKKSPTDIDVLASKRGRKSIFPLRTGRLSGSETGALNIIIALEEKKRKNDRCTMIREFSLFLSYISRGREKKKKKRRRRNVLVDLAPDKGYP